MWFKKLSRNIWIWLHLLFCKGKDEAVFFWRERRAENCIWAPSGRDWARARILHRGFKRDVIQFIDGKGKKTRRSPLSTRRRDPHLEGRDKPLIDPRTSGNRSPITGPFLTGDEVARLLNTLGGDSA